MEKYDDEFQGLVYDADRRWYFVFTRISTGLYKFLHLLAQDSRGEVFLIQEANSVGFFRKTLEIKMQDINGALHVVKVKDVQESNGKDLAALFAMENFRRKSEGLNSMPKEWWKPIATSKIPL